MNSAPAHLRLAASVLLRHLSREPARALLLLLRAAPRRWLALGTGRVARRAAPGLTSLALAASGRRPDALQVVSAALRRAGPRRCRWLAEVAVALDAPKLGRQAAASLRPADPHRPRVAALVARVEGDLDRAVRLAGTGRSRAARRLACAVHEEREVLASSGRSPATADATTTAPPHEGRVLHVVTNSLPHIEAGYTIRTQGIARAQRAAGLDAHVVTRVGFPVDIGKVRATEEELVDGVPHHRLLPPSLPPGAVGQVASHVAGLRALVESLRPAVVHAHSKHSNGHAALQVARAVGVPLVYEARGFLEETWRARGGAPDRDFYALSRAAETRCMAEADAVVTLAETMRRVIVDRGVAPEHVHVVPNAVDEHLLNAPADGASVRRSLDISATATVFGVVSTLNDYEGIDVLLDAVHRLPDPDIVLLVVGDGPARAGLAPAVEALGPRVRMVGRVPHARVRDYFAAVDVFCVPRRRTSVTTLVPPLKPLEAMALGRPVLASDLPPLRETVQPGRFGWVAAPGEPDAWAHQMSQLHAHPESARALGAAARTWVRQERTWTAVGARYALVYEQAAARAAERARERVIR